MKKTLLLIVSGFLLSNLIEAQNKYFFGINGGTNYSNIRGNEMAEDNKSEFGYLIGVSFDYYLKENLSLAANLNFERKSFSNELIFANESGDGMIPVEFRFNEDYLAFPVMIKYEFGTTTHFFVNGGPFLAYALSSKAKSDNFPTQNISSEQVRFGIDTWYGNCFFN